MENQNLVQADTPSSIPPIDTITPVIQSDRLDVLVHILALEQLAGARAPDIDLTDSSQMGSPSTPFAAVPRSVTAHEFFTSTHHPDWVAHSTKFARLDGAPDVADRLATASAGECQLAVGYSYGGHMVTGAVDAAVAIHLGTSVARRTSAARVVDRSVNALRTSGWNRNDLRGLLHRWTLAESDSAVLILDGAHQNFDDVLHEITCRFEVFHSEVDFMSSSDLVDLSLTGQGTAQVLFLRGSGHIIGELVDSNQEVVRGAFVDEFAAVALSVLWSPIRRAATDAEHEARLRRLRLAGLKDLIVERVLQRSAN